MLNLCITFDYELFMGENFLPEDEVLIRPADEIGEMLRDVGVCATFFADVCCPIRYRQLGKPGFPRQFDEQLVRLHALGHDVQLHIHPNWLAATAVGETVRFDRETYRLHNWADGDNYEKVTQIILDGKKYLEDLLTADDPDYRCVAFRAGGYCIQPEQKIAPSLRAAGLVIDSSVCCGFAHEGDGMSYDYRGFREPFNCRFSATVGFDARSTEETDGAIFEIPIGGFGRFPQRLIASRMNASTRRDEPRGRSMSLEHGAANRRLFHRLRNAAKAVNMLTLDSYNEKPMTYMLRSLAKHTKGDVYTAAIAHPKMMHEAQIADMRAALLKLKNERNIRFVTMRECADLLRLTPDGRSDA